MGGGEGCIYINGWFKSIFPVFLIWPFRTLKFLIPTVDLASSAPPPCDSHVTLMQVTVYHRSPSNAQLFRPLSMTTFQGVSDRNERCWVFRFAQRCNRRFRILGYDALRSTFWLFWITEPLKMTATRSFETSTTTYPATPQHIPDDRVKR